VHRFFLAEYSDLGLGWILGRGWGRLGEDVEVIVLDLEGIGPHAWKVGLDGVFAAAMADSAGLVGVVSTHPTARRHIGEVTLLRRREANPFLLPHLYLASLPGVHVGLASLTYRSASLHIQS
jgi:hypothetical protein